MNVLKVEYGKAGASKRFAESLRDTGFAVITHHPVPSGLVETTFADWKRFFEGGEKNQYLFNPETQSGYFPFRTENAKDSKIKDLKEFFHVYPWTEIPKSLGPASRNLFDRLSGLGTELLEWLQTETPEEVRKNFSMPLPSMAKDCGDNLMRPIHYPPLTGGEEEGAIRAAAHEDINLITLLPAATAPGLQVKDTRGNWHDVPCDPGSIVINAGDMLQMCSDGYYKSTTHRVVNPKGPDAKLPRYSMPLFIHARKDVPLSERYTAGSYLTERLLEIGLLKKAAQEAANAQQPRQA